MSRKNPGKFSPLFYVRDLKFEQSSLKVEDSDIIKRESSEMVESFISSDNTRLKKLKIKLIYGELLDYKLFINNNFKDLLNKMNEINEKEKSNLNKDKKEKKGEEFGNEKPDKSGEKIDILRKYEELGFMFAGDVIYSKASRESIKYYKNSDLEFKIDNSKDKELKKK